MERIAAVSRLPCACNGPRRLRLRRVGSAWRGVHRELLLVDHQFKLDAGPSFLEGTRRLRRSFVLIGHQVKLDAGPRHR
jgi:hypothetical protein